MEYAPIARIIIRYAVGIVIGADSADVLAANPDLITLVAAGVAVVVEGFYAWAKKKGWPT